MQKPIRSELPQPIERFAILRAIRGLLTGNYVVRRADRETIYFHTPLPHSTETLDSIGSEDQVKIKRPVFELHEVFATLDLAAMLGGDLEADFNEREQYPFAVLH